MGCGVGRLALARAPSDSFEHAERLHAEIGQATLRHQRHMQRMAALTSHADMRTALETAQARITKARIREADLYCASCFEADFSGANLEGADLRGADLKLCNFSGANLRRANLSNSNIGGGARLQGANLETAQLNNAILKNAEYDEHTRFPPRFDPQKNGLLRRPA